MNLSTENTFGAKKQTSPEKKNRKIFPEKAVYGENYSAGDTALPPSKEICS